MSETTTTTENSNPNLSITDIADAVKIIDYACENGAFRGWGNIRQIMLVRDRLDAFVTVATASMAQEVNKEAPVLNEAEVPANKPRPKRKAKA